MTHRLTRSAASTALLGVTLALAPGCARDTQPAKSAHQKPTASAAKVDAPPGYQALGDGAYRIADVAESVNPSVVAITTSTLRKVRSRRGDPFFERFFGPDAPREFRDRGLGSGVIIDDGLVLTNHHVIARASDIRVRTADGRELQAEVVGSDPKSDLAVLRLQGNTQGLRVIRLGDSSKVRLGEVVLAVGNPFGVGQTVTMGIVSAKGRADVGIVDYENFIQTDAAINPGNSGGALVNLRGELVGVNTAILSRSGASSGVGFAIPSNMVKPIMKSLVQNGRVVRGYLGILIQDVTADLATALGMKKPRGVLVSQVNDDSPASAAGVRRGDIILKVNGKVTNSAGQLRNLVAYSGANSSVKLDILRDGKSKKLRVKLGTLPGDEKQPRRSKRSDKTTAGGLELADLDAALRRELKIPGSVRGGVVVVSVDPRSEAARAGIRRGMVIVEVDKQPVSSVRDFERLYESGAKAPALLLVARRGGTRYVSLAR